MRLPSFDFPLLYRELTELSAQRRTYVLRVLYAFALFIATYFLFADVLGSGDADPFARLGRGREVYLRLTALQAVGVLLFMPAMTSSVITFEKERNSLALLLLTKLGPWKIVLEKLLSRLVPMCTFLLLALPLTAAAYSMGGVTAFELWAGFTFLVMLAAQVGSVAVMCSAWCSTTVGAFVASYLIIGASSFCCMPAFGATTSPAGPMAFAGVFAFSVVSTFVVCGVCLTLARIGLIERAFARPRNVLLEWFKGLDAFFTDLNRVTGGKTLFDDDKKLPEDKPIAWRETSKRSLGTARYLFRVLVATELPVLCVMVWNAGSTRAFYGDAGSASGLLYLVWITALLLIAIKATTLFAGERARQTLDVLATVPLTGAEIVKQKTAGLRRLIAVLYVPFLTIFGFEAYWGATTNGWTSSRVLGYAVGSVVSLSCLLFLATWMCVMIGMVIRSQSRAIIASLSLVGVQAAIAPTVSEPTYVGLLDAFFNNGFQWLDVVGFVLLPVTATTQLQYGPVNPFVFLFAMGAALVAATLFRWFCLSKADAFLHRAETRPHSDVEPEE